LLLACKNNDIQLAKSILSQKSININQKDSNSKTALMYACINCNYELVELLVLKGGKINDFKIDHTKGLYDGYNDETNYSTPLFFAIKNLSDCTKYEECSHIIFLLIENNAYLYDRFTFNSLFTYIMEKNVFSDEICYILNRLLRIETCYPQLRLNDACSNKNIDIKYVEFLLENKYININYKDKYGFTALMKCVEIDKMELLLKNGIDINASDNDQNTPFLYMCKRGFYDGVLFLYENGADPYIKNNNDENALMICNNIKIMDFLLENLSFDINECSHKKLILSPSTLWHKVSKYFSNETSESLEMIELLLKKGANMYNPLTNKDDDFFIFACRQQKIQLISLAFKNNYFLINKKDIISMLLREILARRNYFFQRIIEKYILYFHPIIEFNEHFKISITIINSLIEDNKIIITDSIFMKEIQKLILLRDK